MLFEELDKIKRTAALAAVLGMSAGLMLLIAPPAYVPFIGGGCGFALLVAMVVSIMDFIGGKRVLMSYVRLTAGLVMGLFGLALLVFEDLFASVLYWLVGVLPILVGIYGIYHALAYARRGGRRGWWVLVVLSSLLVAFGAFVFVNPWTGDTQGTMQVIGGTLAYSALVSALSLFWLWPAHAE